MNKGKSSRRKNDPHAKREATHYESPLPSRELILQVLSEQGVPLSLEPLYGLLEIGDDEREIFSKRFRFMTIGYKCKIHDAFIHIYLITEFLT